MRGPVLRSGVERPKLYGLETGVTPTWTVTLDGDADDLRALVDLGVGVTQEGKRFILRSPLFDGLTEARAVDDRAFAQVAIFSGLTRIVEGDARPRTIAVGAIVRDDGKVKALFLSPGTAEFRLHATAALSVGPDDPPISPYPRWAALAVRDQAVQQAVRLFGSQPSAVNLYRVFEVIRQGRRRGEDRPERLDDQEPDHALPPDGKQARRRSALKRGMGSSQARHRPT